MYLFLVAFNNSFKFNVSYRRMDSLSLVCVLIDFSVIFLVRPVESAAIYFALFEAVFLHTYYF